MKIYSMVLTSLSILFASILLISCGASGTNTGISSGGNSGISSQINNSIAEGGISGTGITMGRITNFGSILVNGIRFDINNASFLRDGKPSSGQSEFRVGEFVVINGAVDATGVSGTATAVTFTDILEGSVTKRTTDDLSLEILGQLVKTDQLTVLHGANTLSDLLQGNIVEVSGVRDANGLITATSITLKQTRFNSGESENELKGTISNFNLTNKTFTINNITVDYDTAVLEGFIALELKNGLFVEAKSDSEIVGNTLVATKIELKNEFFNLAGSSEAEIEGLVTGFTSSTDFDVNGLKVTTTSTTRFKNGAPSDIALNSFVEVEGAVNAAGVIIARKVSFEETDSAIELKGQLQSIKLSRNEIELNNQVIVLDASTLMVDEGNGSIPLTINELFVGDNIEIKGIALDDGRILATKLERKNSENNIDDNIDTNSGDDANSAVSDEEGDESDDDDS